MLTIDERNKLILDNIDLVQKNVNRLLRKINIPIDEGELIGQLNVAFVLAANRFDPSRNVPFRRYIDNRLGHCTISYLRSIDHLNVSNRNKQKKIDKAIHELSNEFNRSPTETEIAKYLNMSEEDYRKLSVITQNVSFYSIINKDNTDSPFDIMDDERISNDIIKSLTSSPEDFCLAFELSKRVMIALSRKNKISQLLYILYFVYNFSMKELSSIFGITLIYISRLINKVNIEINQELEAIIKEESNGEDIS